MLSDILEKKNTTKEARSKVWQFLFLITFNVLLLGKGFPISFHLLGSLACHQLVWVEINLNCRANISVQYLNLLWPHNFGVDAPISMHLLDRSLSLVYRKITSLLSTYSARSPRARVDRARDADSLLSFRLVRSLSA